LDTVCNRALGERNRSVAVDPVVFRFSVGAGVEPMSTRGRVNHGVRSSESLRPTLGPCQVYALDDANVRTVGSL
jgi:hypothetical protein